MGGLTRMMGKSSARKQANKGKRGIANAKTRGKARLGLSNKRRPALTGIDNAMTRGKASVGLAHKRAKPSSIAANRSGYSKLGQMFSSVKKKKRKKRRRLLG